MHRKLFDDAIGPVPPSTVDVDAVVARQRRAAVIRRVAGPGFAAAAGVVAVTFGIAVALPGGTGGTGGLVPGAGPGTSPPTTTEQAPSSSAPSCGASGRPVTEDPAVAAARLTEVMTAAVRARLPDAQLAGDPTANTPDDRQYGPLEFFSGRAMGVGTACPNVLDWFRASAIVAGTVGPGDISAFIGRVDDPDGPHKECEDRPSGGPENPEVTCGQQAGPNGEQIVVYTTIEPRLHPTGPRVKIHEVHVAKPDGTGVVLYSKNTAGQPKLAAQPERETPPLTHEQLIAIALVPGLTLYPPG